MKNIFFIVTLLLSVNNLTQAYMLESTKDSVVSALDSTEVTEAEILYFSNTEIAKIILISESLNPQIQDLSLIKTTDTVVLRINDSSAYSFSPLRGESCWKVLEKGINTNKIRPIDDLASETKLVDSAIVVSAPDLSKENHAQKEKSKKLSSVEKIEKEEKSSNELPVFLDYKKGHDDTLSSDSSSKNEDTLSYSLSTREYGYNDHGNSKKITRNELVIGIIFSTFFFIALFRAWKNHRKNRPYSQARYRKDLRRERRLEIQKIKEEGSPLRE